jgi:TonB family protein
MQQHDAVAPQSTDPNIAQPSGVRGQPPVDVRSDLLMPSKIRSQAPTPVQQVNGDSVEIMSNADNLPMMPANSPVLPRLEEPKSVAASTPKTTLSPQPIRVIQPEYPAKARLWHIEGEVFLEITIDRNGNVQKVRSLSGNAILLQAAEEAVRRWKYLPASEDQVSLPTVTRVRFNFKLDPEARNR